MDEQSRQSTIEFWKNVDLDEFMLPLTPELIDYITKIKEGKIR